MGLPKQHIGIILIAALLALHNSTCITLSTIKSIDKKNSLSNDVDTEIDPTVQSKALPEKCTGGRVYEIRDAQDLLDYESEWDCIFRSAVPPNKVPEGALYGTPLELFSLTSINPLVKMIWGGVMTDRVICNGSDTYLGWNNGFGKPFFPFLAYVGKFKDVMNLDPLEYNDNVNTIFIDHGKDVSTVCPDLDSVVEKHKDTMVVQISDWGKANYPMSGAIDALRLVGRQSDGGAIYLGKTFYRDHFTADHVARSGVFFSMVSYDPDVNPEFKIGDSLPPLDRDFYFRKTGVLDALDWVLPIHKLIKEPIHTTKHLFKIADGVVRDVGVITKGIFLGVGSSSDCKRFKDLFAFSRPYSNTSGSSSSTSYLLSSNEVDHSHFNEL